MKNIQQYKKIQIAQKKRNLPKNSNSSTNKTQTNYDITIIALISE